MGTIPYVSVANGIPVKNPAGSFRREKFEHPRKDIIRGFSGRQGLFGFVFYFCVPAGVITYHTVFALSPLVSPATLSLVE
jgi:hypothetical protein